MMSARRVGLVLLFVLVTLLVIAALAHSAPPYVRSEWFTGWKASEQSACINVREEALIRHGESVKLSPDGCSVIDGRWRDPYTNVWIYDAKELDIDHVVPLKWAHEHGGAAWPRERKRAFAQDMDYCCHLVPVKASENRSKSDRGPADYQPPSGRCEYAIHFVVTVWRYGLTVDAREREALDGMLGSCRRFYQPTSE